MEALLWESMEENLRRQHDATSWQTSGQFGYTAGYCTHSNIDPADNAAWGVCLVVPPTLFSQAVT